MCLLHLKAVYNNEQAQLAVPSGTLAARRPLSASSLVSFRRQSCYDLPRLPHDARVVEGGGHALRLGGRRSAPACRRSPRAARPKARRVVVVITGADGRCHAARALGAGEDVIAYQARAAVRQKRARPDDAPRRARVPEGEAPAGAEPATGAVPPLTAAGTADAARPAPPTPPTPPTRAALAIAPPVNPGCPTRLLVTGELVAAMVPPGVMAGRRSAMACNRIARSPGMFCRFIHDGAMKWRSPDTTGDVAKRALRPRFAPRCTECAEDL